MEISWNDNCISYNGTEGKEEREYEGEEQCELCGGSFSCCDDTVCESCGSF